MKQKKLFIIIPLLILIVFGITYAFFSWQSSNRTSVTITTGEITVTYSAGPNITGIKLIPVSSKEKGVVDNVAVYKEITASSTEPTYMDLNMTLQTFPTNLKHESLVWEIYTGNTLLNSGNLGNSTQGDIIKLLEGQPLTSTTSNFKLYIWIDGLQSNSTSMMNQDFTFILNATATDKNPNLDVSGANAPKLVQGLIPVRYDNTNGWVKADSRNTDTNNQWYDYNSKMWANAVLVSSTNRETYQNANAGTAIPESEVLAYYVWIPRYKYKVFNINKVIGTDSYNARTTGIDIQFETGTATTGTISCTYDFSKTATASVRNETCTGSNGDYYTHPAFWWDLDGDSVHDTGEELEGIWVGKFEISSETPSATDGGGSSTTLTVRTKPNINSWRANELTNFYKVIYDMQTSNNIYGLSTDRTNTDSHMLKNMEWGAVAYLTNSNYGRCSNNICTDVTINDNYDFYTGGNNYIANVMQSTTGNIYGIYDMSGGSFELVIGNASSATGTYSYNAQYAGSNYTYSASTAKYIDTYAYGTTNTDQSAYNRSRLGDATGETKSWYSDRAEFVFSPYYWFRRGGNVYCDSDAGLFFFDYSGGGAMDSDSTRAALIGF